MGGLEGKFIRIPFKSPNFNSLIKRQKNKVLSNLQFIMQASDLVKSECALRIPVHARAD
jgi:hypothetical protein